MKRTVYLGDLHSSKLFESFVKRYDDGNTKFICVGDFFDRGTNSLENYRLARKLHKEGKFELVLGNHDIWFIVGVGLSKEHNGFIYNKIKQLETENEELFKLYKLLQEDAYADLSAHGKATLESLTGNEDLNEVAEWLFQFNTFLIDENKNLIVHGGIPYLEDGTLVNVLKDDGEMTNGVLELFEYMNSRFKELDFSILDFFSNGISRKYSHVNMYYELKNKGMILDDSKFNHLLLSCAQDMNLMWYDNSKVFSFEGIRGSLKRNLKELGIKALICGHSGNAIPVDWFNGTGTDYWKHMLGQSETVIRLDRSFKGDGNFGYLTLEDGVYKEVGDSINFV